MNSLPTKNHQPPTRIRPANLEDFEIIYGIFSHVLEAGTTYSYTLEEMPPERALAYWMTAPGTHGFVAECQGEIAGFFAVRPNRTGRAKHVANASFIVAPGYRRKGIGRKMGQHALKVAKKLGYKAMQFNFVVGSNDIAVNLWQSLGFEIVGTLPKGYRHATQGFVDVYMMHRFL